MNLRDYRNKLVGTIVSQYYNRHPSNKRIGVVTGSSSRKSEKHLIVKWWNYNTGNWSERNSHPKLSDVRIESPELGYFVDSLGNLSYIEDAQRNQWSYGYSYKKLRQYMDTYNILSFYGIYSPRTCPDYISKSQIYINNRSQIVTNNCLIEEVTNDTSS